MIELKDSLFEPDIHHQNTTSFTPSFAASLQFLMFPLAVFLSMEILRLTSRQHGKTKSIFTAFQLFCCCKSAQSRRKASLSCRPSSHAE